MGRDLLGVRDGERAVRGRDVGLEGLGRGGERGLEEGRKEGRISCQA